MPHSSRPAARPLVLTLLERWLQRPLGRRCVQLLIVALVMQGLPLPELSRHYRWHSPIAVSGLAPLLDHVASVPARFQMVLTQWLGQPTVQAHGQASRIYTIDPSCAQPGDQVKITGNGFGAQNLAIYVGGAETAHGVITGGLRAPLVSAFGNRATFIVPLNAPGGVSIVWAVNPGGHAGFIAFRVRTAEACGDGIDQDCSGVADDPQICMPINHPPLAHAGSAQTQAVGTTVQLDGTGSSDADGDLLGFQWTLSAPSGSSAMLNAPTSATPAFTIDRPGTYTATLSVNDGHVTSTPDTVVVSTVNSRPVSEAGAAQGGQIGTVITLDGSGSSDVDGDRLTYQWTLASKPATSSASLSDPTSVTPRFTIDAFGQYVVRLVVHDGTVASEADSVVIDTFNSPPVAKAGADTAGQVGQTITLNGSGSSDVDGNALTYSWSLLSTPSGSTATLQDASTATPSFGLDRAGTYLAQLVVNDGLANSTPDTVTISTVNTKPVAHAGPAQSGTVGTVIVLDGSQSSDVDGDSLTYHWSLITRPVNSTATLAEPSSVSPRFTLDQAGTYLAQLIVDDVTVASDPATVTISTINSAPTAEAGAAQSGTVGTTITLDGSGSRDVDGDSLTYLWTVTDRPATSTASLSDPSVVRPTILIDQPGNYTVQLLVHDGTVTSTPDTVTVSTINSAPVAEAGADQTVETGTVVPLISGSGSRDADNDPLTYQWSLLSQPEASTATVSNATTSTPRFTPEVAGVYVVQLIVTDGTVASAPDTVTITASTPDTTPPPPANGGLITTSSSGGQTTVRGAAGSVEGGARVTVTNSATNQPVTVTANADGSFTAVLGAQPGNLLTIGVSDAAGNSSVPITTQVEPLLPPDPATIAPPIDRTVATTVFDATAFLYTGSTPIQTGVAAGTIEPKRAAVIRGKVLKKDNSPLSGVTITVLSHPELGQTLSRVDGMFDMAVNGGGVLTFNYAKPGYLPAQRQIDAPWQDYAFLPDVVLIQPDPQVTTIDLTDTTQPMQVAAGSVVTDADGTRQAVVMIPQGTTATLVMPDGSTQPLTTLNVRLTEYTVGENGPEAMPGALPPTSGYTYAVELSADEAITAGARQVTFSQPLPIYVDNFLAMPVGGVVPVGAFDREQGTWVPQPNGKVLKILAVSDGVAQIDSNNDNVADDAATLTALGISVTEQVALAETYTPGGSIWRTTTRLFQGVDFNWGVRPPADAIVPNGADMSAKREQAVILDNPDGAGILYQPQALAQQVDLTGAPFALHYRSDRSRARADAYTLTIPVSGPSIPASLKRIEVDIRIAGRLIKQSFAPRPNVSLPFTWDGKDVYGRGLNGSQLAGITIRFFYPLAYQQPVAQGPAFGQTTGVPLSPTVNARGEIAATRQWAGPIGTWEAKGQGVGGWSLDAHHVYDPIGHALYHGDGTQRSSQNSGNGNLGAVITTFAGSNRTSGAVGDGGPAINAYLVAPSGVAVDSAGNVYVADSGGRVLKVTTNGVITTVAGGGSGTASGVPATSVALQGPRAIALDKEGNFYITETHRVRKVDRNGIITTIAGTGVSGFNGDGGPAVNAQLNHPSSLAVDRVGNLYIGEEDGHRIRKIAPNGIITTVAGTGALTSVIGNGLPATQVSLWAPSGIAVDGQGNLFIADRGNDVIRKVTPGGIQHIVVGQYRSTCGGCPGAFNGDGLSGTQTLIGDVRGLAVDPDGNLYFANIENTRVRRLNTDGLVTTVAGNGSRLYSGDGGAPLLAGIPVPMDVAIGPDRALYIATDFGITTPSDRVRRVTSVLPGFAGVGDILVASQDDSEVYIFNENGRHLRTVNPLTNSLIYSFGYDSARRLITVTDANTNVTTITRDASGNVTGITGPYGQSNTITLDANGYLASLTNPNGETTSFSYTADGLLTSSTPPGKPASSFQYDSGGRLIQASDPAGGGDTLVRSAIPNGYQVQHGTAAGEQSTYKVEYLPDGQQRRTNVLPDGTQQVTLIGTDGKQTITQPDGITQTVSVTGDPRFGLQSPIPTTLNVNTPGGKAGTLTNSRTATLSDPSNPLSLTSQTDTVNFNGRTATRTYNATTRTATDTSPAGRRRTTVTDPQGRVTQQQQGTLAPTAFSYDARGRLATRSQGGRSTSLTYDSLGRPQTITDSASRTVQFQYDSAGRVTQQTLPDNRVIGYTYDASGNVTAITPPGRPPHEFTYTAVNLEKDYLAPFLSSGGTNTTSYTYDVDRRVTRITRPDGQHVTLTYDPAGRLSAQVFPSPEPLTPSTLSYGYNAQGNLSSAALSGGGTVNYTYDGSLLLNSSWSGPVSGSVSWTYDNNYRKTSQSVNGGNTITFGYDTDDLLTSAGAMTLTRDATNGLLSGTTLGTVTDSMTYTSLGEVATATSSVGGSALLSETYARDSLGRISTKTETIQGVTTTFGYTYDVAGRLTEVKQNGLTVATYAYDSNSNRLSKTAPGGTTSYTYDAQDRLLTAGGNAYAYTANGELLSKTPSTQPLAPSTYSYDALGNLRSATLGDGTQLSYVIDGENRRIGKTVNGSLVQGFLYENQLEPVAELDGSGNLVSRFVYCGCGAGNIPQYMLKGGVTYRILADHLGSPRLVVDTTTGAVMQRMDYDEFGNVTLDTNPGFQPFGFAGGIYDRDTGLVRHGARDYDPETGRWTAKDPIRFAGGDSNLYGYVLTDPINGLDLNGHFGINETSTVSTFVNILAVLASGPLTYFGNRWGKRKFQEVTCRPVMDGEDDLLDAVATTVGGAAILFLALNPVTLGGVIAGLVVPPLAVAVTGKGLGLYQGDNRRYHHARPEGYWECD